MSSQCVSVITVEAERKTMTKQTKSEYTQSTNKNTKVIYTFVYVYVDTCNKIN